MDDELYAEPFFGGGRLAAELSRGCGWLVT